MQFEYDILVVENTNSSIISELDELGKGGWELVSVIKIANGNLQLFLKRKKEK